MYTHPFNLVFVMYENPFYLNYMPCLLRTVFRFTTLMFKLFSKYLSYF